MGYKIDPVWEQKYSEGHREMYPWDTVVSFVFSNSPKDKPRNQVRILEVGFGTGSNLWFAAREGFHVSGIEASQSAVDFARRRFEQENLRGELLQGSFTDLPFDTDSFDLVIDRGALVCVGWSDHRAAIGEIARVLKPGGRFHYNGYCDSDSSLRCATPAGDGLVKDIREGGLAGVGQLLFVSRREVGDLFRDGWKTLSLYRREFTNMAQTNGDIHAQWLGIFEKLF